MNSVVDANEDNFELHNSMGISCMHARDMEQAMMHFERASFLNQEDPDARFNKASCLMAIGKHKEALLEFRESYAKSKSEKSMIGMSCAKAEMMDLHGAIDLLEMVLEKNPENHEARTNMSSLLHLAGRWKEAWKYYKSRLVHYESLKRHVENLGIPMWDGDVPPEGDVLVFSEQGTGDTINFGRLVALLQKRLPDRKVRAFVSPGLRGLLESQGVSSTHVTDGFGSCCSMMDIPGILGLSESDVFGSFVRMRASKTCDMSRFSGLFKIGVCWAGNPAHPKDQHRSFSLSLFREAGRMKDVKLFSLQKDKRPRIWPSSKVPVDLCSGCEDMRLVDMSPHMNSWEDTAAIISSLDLVISADTSVMHLSASLGKETWGLLPYVPDWRWGLGSERVCWYPSLRLFRQKSRGGWEGVFSAVIKELHEKLEAVQTK